MSVKDLYFEYITYCNNKFKPKNKIEFKNTLKNVNIDCYKSNSKHIYNYTYQQLKEISDKYHWIHELDEDVDEDEDLDENPIDYGIEKNNIKLNDDKDLKISNLENKIKELEAQLLKVNKPHEKELTDEELEKELEELNFNIKK